MFELPLLLIALAMLAVACWLGAGAVWLYQRRPRQRREGVQDFATFEAWVNRAAS